MEPGAPFFGGFGKIRADATPFLIGQIRRVSLALHSAERRQTSRSLRSFQTVSLHPPGRPGTEGDHHALSTHALLKGAMSAPITPLKIMLVEDQTAFRQALAFVLAKEQELEVVAQAGSLAEAREALDGGLEGRLDVALLDL